MRFNKTKLLQNGTATSVPYGWTYSPSKGPKSNFEEDKRFEEESTRFLIRSHILMELGTKVIIEDKERQLQ